MVHERRMDAEDRGRRYVDVPNSAPGDRLNDEVQYPVAVAQMVVERKRGAVTDAAGIERRVDAGQEFRLPGRRA